MATVAADPAPLTAKQREIFTFIYEFTREYGYQPSVRELIGHFGFTSVNAAFGHLSALQRKGWLGSCHGRSRSMVFRRRPDGEPFAGFADKEYP